MLVSTSPRSLIFVLAKSFRTDHKYCVTTTKSQKTHWTSGLCSSSIHTKQTVNVSRAGFSPLHASSDQSGFWECVTAVVPGGLVSVLWWKQWEQAGLCCRAGSRGRKHTACTLVFTPLKWKRCGCQAASRACAESCTNLGTAFPQHYLRPAYSK